MKNYNNDFEEYEYYEEQPQKVSFWKKKVIGMPIFLLVILGIGLIVAATIYVALHTEFIKTIYVSHGGTVDNHVTVTAIGDVSSSAISCVNGGCGTSDITLTNNDVSTHSCTVTTTPTTNSTGVINVSYTNSVVNGQAIALQANQSLTFQIHYSSDTDGNYPMKTVIDCP